MNDTNKLVGVLGSGQFGLTVANLLAENSEVLLYSRTEASADKINKDLLYKNVTINSRVKAVNSLEEIADKCKLIFPILPAKHFREVIREISPYIRPYHMLIHGTKGLDLVGLTESKLSESVIDVTNVRTMSEVILEETSTLRVGCLSGPNLSSEILEGQPTATVLVSEFDEVIKAGQLALASNRFFVFASHDLKGAELAGAFKNVIAIASGILDGLNLGRNIQALLITRGLREMIHFGKVMGADSRAFWGVAGIGDLIATATSSSSRNHTVGYRLAKGETIKEIVESMNEIAEGVRTLKVAEQISSTYKLHAPITNAIYSIVYEGYSIRKAINSLMRYPHAPDVDYL